MVQVFSVEGTILSNATMTLNARTAVPLDITSCMTSSPNTTTEDLVVTSGFQTTRNNYYTLGN